MTSPDAHQTGHQKAATGRKDQLQPEQIFQRVPIKPKAPDHLKNTTTKTAVKNARIRKAVLTSRQAALPVAKRSRSRQRAGRIPVAHLMAARAQANHFLKAGPTAAVLPTTIQGRPKALAAKEQATKSRFPHAANRQQV